MDNFTHSLVGWAIGQTGLKRKSRKGLAALILGANMPDIDVFFGWVSWAPLATHRGFTHGLLGGVLLLPPVLAGLLWLLDRWQVTRGATFKSGLAMDFRWLVGLSYIGAISHPLLDMQNSYAVQLFSPVSNLWFHNDSLFIIDVWIWTGLAFAIWLSRRRERRGGNWQRPALAALAVLLVYIGGNTVVTRFAKGAPLRDAPGAPPEIVFASPPPVEFYRRQLVWWRDGIIRYGEYNPLSSLFSLTSRSEPEPDNMTDPLARRAMRATPPARDFMNWSVLPVADVERGRCGARVRFSDARFGRRDLPEWVRDRDGADGEEDGGVPMGVSVWLPLKGTGCPPAAR